MTFRQFAKKHLVANGMCESDATAVIEWAMKHKLLKSMKDRWDSSTDSEPRQLRATLISGLRKVAIEWIEENADMLRARQISKTDSQ